MRVSLRLHTGSNANNIFKVKHRNVNVQAGPEEPTISCHRCNQNNRTSTIAIVVYCDNNWGWHYGLILHQIWITASKSNTHKITNVPSGSPVQGQRHRSIDLAKINTRPKCIVIEVYFDRELVRDDDLTLNESNPQLSLQTQVQGCERTFCSSGVNEIVSSDKRRPIITIVIYVDGERRWNYGRRTPITRLKSIAQKYTRTCCSSGTSEIVNWCNHDNQTPIVTIVIYVDRERRWNYDHRTPITWRKSNTQEYKLTHCSPRTNELRPSMQPR